MEWKDSRHIIRYLINTERDREKYTNNHTKSTKESRLLGKNVTCTLEDRGFWEKSVLLLMVKRLRKTSTRKRSSNSKWKKYPYVLFLRTFSTE